MSHRERMAIARFSFKSALNFSGVAHASRVLVSASRRNNLFFGIRSQQENGNAQGKFAIARTRSPIHETRALPRETRSHFFRKIPACLHAEDRVTTTLSTPKSHPKGQNETE